MTDWLRLDDALRKISAGLPCEPTAAIYHLAEAVLNVHVRTRLPNGDTTIPHNVWRVPENGRGLETSKYRSPRSEDDLHIVEDPLEQNDFEGYARLTELVGNRCKILGDDLFVTDIKRLAKGIEMGATNSILIKPNQVGTLSDTIDTVKLARANGFDTVISHRSGETTDFSIAHLGVAFGSYAIKTGVVGGERTAKLNELIRIQEDLED